MISRLLDLRIVVRRRIGSKRPINPHWVLEDHPLRISFAFSFRFNAIVAYWLFLATFDAALPAC